MFGGVSVGVCSDDAITSTKILRGGSVVHFGNATYKSSALNLSSFLQ